MKRMVPALVALLLTLVLASGCGGDDAPPADQPTGTQTNEDDGGGY